VPTITDWIQAISTIALITVTAYFAWDTRQATKDRITPYLSWQEPQCAHFTDLATTIRLQFDLVLWNIGGAARIVRTDARSESNEKFAFDHFLESSILPAPNQSVVHIFKDYALDLAYVGVRRELLVRVDYQDVATGVEYETTVTVVGVFSDATPEVVDTADITRRPIPGIRELGINASPTFWFLTDHRTPKQRELHKNSATQLARQDKVLFWSSLYALWALALLAITTAGGQSGLVLFVLSLIVAIGVLLIRDTRRRP
jgi:hypothetical protein